MKKAVYGWALLTMFFMPFAVAEAQSDSAKENDKAQFKLGVYYNSGLNYYGRGDSFDCSGFFSLAEIWFNKNFYGNAAAVFVNNKISGFDYSGIMACTG